MSDEMKGLFITFEGGEGSGKSTVIESLKQYFLDKGINVLVTREPGGIKISEEIRKIILDVDNTMMTPHTETLLYAASRVQHLEEKVIPALNNGTIVLCDRYIDSSLVYQGIARNVGIEAVMNANHFALEHMPDVTFFLDLEPEIGLARVKGRGKMDRLDLESLSFHKQVYDGYKLLAEKYNDRIVTINARKAPNEVFNDIIEVINKKL